MPTSLRVNQLKIISSSALGNMLEFYDFTLYGFLVALIAPLYFPSNSPSNSLILGFGVFSIGFMARPLGGLYFGYIGDKYGRKYALSATLTGIGLSTAAIGCLPSYESIGITAPLLLVLLRIIQGFCAGGEYNGAGIFVVENTPPHHQGLIGSLLTASGCLGSILACAVSLIFVENTLTTGSWRIPFILGAVICFVGLYLRTTVQEQPLECDEQQQQPRFIDVLRSSSFSVFSVFLMGGCATVPLYIITTYMNSHLKISGVIDTTQLIQMNLFTFLILTCTLPLWGFLSDKIGHVKLMFLSALGTLCLSYPFFKVYQSQHLTSILVFQAVMIFLNAGFVAPSNAYMSSLFPKKHRYLGIAFSYSLGLSFMGGTAPYVAGSLVKATGSQVAPFICLVYASVAGMIAIRKR